MKLLALDFDGVISDSAPECFVVALRTWCEMRGASPDWDDLDRLLGPDAPPVEAIEGRPLYRAFLEMMPLGNRAEDYAVELAALAAGERLADQAAYDAFKSGIDPAWLRAFHQRFYRIRTTLSRTDPRGWYGLMAPYPGIPELLRRRSGEVVLAIATSKDRRSVGKLLERYAIADLFPEGSVLDKENGADKRAHLEHLARRYDLGFPEMTFLDDKVNHLDAVAALEVRCGLAAWGYNGEREFVQARQRGYLVVSLDDLESRLFGGGKT